MLNGKKLIFNQYSNRLFLTALGFAGLALLVFIVFSPYIPKNFELSPGSASPKTIFSPSSITIETASDQAFNSSQKQQITQSIAPVFQIDDSVNKTIRDSIELFFSEIKEQQTNIAYPRQSRIRLADLDYTFLYTSSPSDLDTLEYYALLIADSLLSDGIKSNDIPQLTSRLQQRLKLFKLPTNEKTILISILEQSLVPNLKENVGLTQSNIQEALNAYIPKQTEIKKGQQIILKGEMVDESHIQALNALGLIGRQINSLKFVGILFICFFTGLLLEQFLRYFKPKVHRKLKYFILTYCTVVAVLALARAIQLIPTSELFQWYFLIPISLSALIISSLVTPNISLITGTAISILVSIMYNHSFLVFFYLFFNNTTTCFAYYKNTHQKGMLKVGYLTGGINCLLIITIGLLQTEPSLMWYSSNIVLGFLSGIISVMLSLAVLPYFESIFNITTNQRLLELSNLNHPLLKKLLLTAPGTYQHSIMVANLAESAAESIHANPILCRIGGYFHDIGKMKRPIFFSENQFSHENPHTHLAPRISKMIIAAHTKDGEDMAKEYRLPKVIKEMMLEHHGTSLVSFFYSQALKQNQLDEDDEAIKNSFRYPGPKPHFKESGILMLADSVEAAVRSLEKPSLHKIENLIQKIFKDKLEDGQLDQCPLTIKEINLIKESFLTVFKGMYHQRLNYQKEIDNIEPSEK